MNFGGWDEFTVNNGVFRFPESKLFTIYYRNEFYFCGCYRCVNSGESFTNFMISNFMISL